LNIARNAALSPLEIDTFPAWGVPAAGNHYFPENHPLYLKPLKERIPYT
jgi:hypothetical protein